jgi:general stress protein 26
MPRRKSAEPKAGRPHMPGYGIHEDLEGILPWTWARERLESSRNYWIATLRPDGRPHTMPVWGLWIGDRLFFSTAITSTKARNLLANSNCTATTESGTEAVIVEGRADVIDDKDVLKPVWKAYKEKYDWPMDGENMFAITPTTVFAFIETAEQFATAATRWRFG